MSKLHEQIASVLKWTVREAQSFSLPALRELVRPVNEKLADEITQALDHTDYRCVHDNPCEPGGITDCPLCPKNPREVCYKPTAESHARTMAAFDAAFPGRAKKEKTDP